MRHGLSELAHEYTAMGILGPIQLIGRRRGEYPLVQDTVSISHYQESSGRTAVRMVGMRTTKKFKAPHHPLGSHCR